MFSSIEGLNLEHASSAIANAVGSEFCTNCMNGTRTASAVESISVPSQGAGQGMGIA